MAFDAQITFLPVSDLVASRAFYEGVLGLPVAADQKSCLIFATGMGSFLGVCERDNASPSAGVIVTLVADDVDVWSQKLTEANVHIVSGPDHNEAYGIYHVFFNDPDGHLLEIQRFDNPNWAAGS